ncbi:hypothetical protein [Paractinoplanes bogorensis]|uniref:hypothetical protein n=1 Tax=Paractinoplanes bogorensis TaxID=1610840 RepID=UPI001FE54340|nr:hypothetical protein [Actinoplanes bogorensis]
MRRLVVVLLLLALGMGVSFGLSEGLRLSWEPAPVMAEPTAAAATERTSVRSPIGSVSLGRRTHRLDVAARAVSEVADGPGVLRVVVGEDSAGESYRLDGLTLTAAGEAGAVAGLYDVAAAIRAGRALPSGQVAPRLGLRLTDVGSVGRVADVPEWRDGTDYSLNTDIVTSALLPEAPWVSPDAVDRIGREFRQFIDHSAAQGYNGVVVPGFLEYVTFAGHGVYADGDAHIERARAMVSAFRPVFAYAADMGMRVYFLTDMLALSGPLETYLETHTDPWPIYQAALRELFASMPFASGLMVRVGEGGSAYRAAGWDYYSRIALTTPAQVRAMLEAFLAVAAETNKDIIFRTWTVGVGAVGDLHTNPESYRQVLGDLVDPHLIVSTKFTLGDFYSHLPLNTTLGVGSQRRIVEFQGRREFEGFGSLPNDLTALHADALGQLLAQNPHIEGVWLWTQDGGPLHAGPMTLYLRTGFWQLYDLNAYAMGRLARAPDTDPAAITADWVRQTFSDDPATVAAVGRMFAMSREAVTKGLYLAPYADNSVKALGLEPPPMMWIFEWDIVTGDSSVLDSIYAIGRGDVDRTIADGQRAITLAHEQRALVAATDPAKWRSPELRTSLLDALDYQSNLYETLGAYREMFLRRAQWLDTGSSTARDQWTAAARTFDQARTAHVARYGHRVDLPAYNFTAADLGSERFDRDPAMAWTARILLALLVASMFVQWRPIRDLWRGALTPWRITRADPTSQPPETLNQPRTTPDPPHETLNQPPTTPDPPHETLNQPPTTPDPPHETLNQPPTTPDPPHETLNPRSGPRWFVVAFPLAVLVLSRAVFTWFAAPAHLVVTMGCWVLFAVAARLLVGRRDPYALWTVIGGVVLLRTVLLLAVLAIRGPGYYWFAFWTDPLARSVYVTVAFALFAWLFVATGFVLRTHYGWSRRRVTGAVALSASAPLAALGALLWTYGLERSLTLWNDQLALLPWGLHRILGLVTYLGIPPELPLWLTCTGLALAVLGTGLSLSRHRTQAPRTPTSVEP